MKFLTFILAALLVVSCGNQQQGKREAQEKKTEATAQSVSQIENFNVEQFKELLKDTTVVLLDVRTPEEFGQGHIPGALNIDVKDSLFVQNVLDQVAEHAKVAVYCRSGRRSLTAADKLSAEGYDVVNLEGGFLAWEAVGK